VTLSLTNLVAPLFAQPTTWLVGPVASTYKTNETMTVYSLKNLFEVDSSGNATTNPLGTSGPFVLQVDNEQILCSTTNHDNKVYIYSSAQGNGRGYNGTTIKKHETGGYGSNQVSVVATSVQGGTVASSTVTLTSGTAVQNTASTSATYYVGITGGTAGTVAVAIGSTSAASTIIVPATANNAVASQTLSIRVPSNWYIKVTTSIATINASTVIVTASI